MIRSAVDTSRPLIEAARHELVRGSAARADLPRRGPDAARAGGRESLEQRRSLHRGGRPHLAQRSAARSRTVEITVRDNGIGIPADALPRIFDMFAQVDESLERSQGGLGIGLTLVKRLVEMHGGTVEARSEGSGRGAEFTVRLPRVTAAAPHAAGARDRTCRDGAPIARRVLVADDNRDAAESMGMLLRLMGNEVRTVHDGIKAVEEAATFRPDVILLDIGMPRLNGYDAARLIREQRWSNGTMIVALTGWGQDEDKRRATEAGFDRHFTKPLDPAELREAHERLRTRLTSSSSPRRAARRSRQGRGVMPLRTCYPFRARFPPRFAIGAPSQ